MSLLPPPPLSVVFPHHSDGDQKRASEEQSSASLFSPLLRLLRNPVGSLGGFVYELLGTLDSQTMTKSVDSSPEQRKEALLQCMKDVRTSESAHNG
jgi:hypothetical protein